MVSGFASLLASTRFGLAALGASAVVSDTEWRWGQSDSVGRPGAIWLLKKSLKYIIRT